MKNEKPDELDAVAVVVGVVVVGVRVVGVVVGVVVVGVVGVVVVGVVGVVVVGVVGVVVVKGNATGVEVKEEVDDMMTETRREGRMRRKVSYDEGL